MQLKYIHTGEILRRATMLPRDAGEPIWYKTFKVNGLEVIEGTLERGGYPNLQKLPNVDNL